MLNELKTLADSIRGAGFSGKVWDDKFKEIKVTSPCFVISLSAQGEIADIRPLERDKAAVLRTWQDGSNGETFPSFNFLPFYNIPKDKENALKPVDKREAFTKLVQSVRISEAPPEAVGPVKLQPRSKADVKAAKCLGKIARHFFGITTGNAAQDDPLVRLRDAMATFLPEDAVATFNRKLFAFLQMHLSDGLEPSRSPLWPILYAQKADVVLFFDLADSGAFPIASEKAMRIINERLLTRKDNNRNPQFNGADSAKDAFGEILLPNDLSKLPEVKLPHIGSVILRCMSKDALCQMRYGHIDVNSFPISGDMRKYVKSALVWMASPEREGRTWAIAGKRELVFAYPRTLPPSPPLLARLLGCDTNEARFEDYAKTALKGLKTTSETSSPNTEIEVFAIKKADASSKRGKIVFYRNYSLARLEEAVSLWLAGAENIPEIAIRRWPPLKKGEKAAKGTKPVHCEFHAPLPLVATRLAYTVWAQDGDVKQEPKFRSAPLYEGFPVFDGLELFLGDAVSTGLAERMLSLLLQGSGTLLAAIGNLAHQRGVLALHAAADHLETALPLFGILLHKLNHSKETYMENAPYLIGRFLNLADGLHEIWYKSEKEGYPLPPQLLGNAYFPAFQQNPTQAFASMEHRILPYWAWACSNRGKDEKIRKKARAFRNEMGRIAVSIHEIGLPSRLSDADKTEMLLGYLSYFGKREDSEASKTVPESSDTAELQTIP